MSECMLCQVRRADHPFYIESVGLRIGSVEELLYFFKENLPLLDESILNEGLVRWIKEELHLRRLSVNLSMQLQRKFSVRELVLPIFKEIHYPDDQTIAAVDEELIALEEKKRWVRKKESGDCLFSHGRYLRAIDIWRQAIDYATGSNDAAAFTGAVYHNIGCAYAQLFQMEEAVGTFRQSLELLGTKEARLCYLRAVRLSGGVEGLRKAAVTAGVDGTIVKSIEDELTGVDAPSLPEHPEELLRSEQRAYHKNTGM